MSICAIHQPNFLPWLPYFDKISKADTFIFLDEVDYPKSGNSMGSWCNRVKILMNKDEIWFSIPVIRQSGIQKIKTVEINYKEFNISKVL
ncbi:MAG: WbqC family protein, partial [Alphaproteobacteria bacterium]